jgi:hypothetical protein
MGCGDLADAESVDPSESKKGGLSRSITIWQMAVRPGVSAMCDEENR